MVREGMALRGWPIKEVRSIAVEATCKDKCVAAFAALVEIDDD
jgi:pyruvoyl-dependent arginine decarboxylase (PvlArgDC)